MAASRQGPRIHHAPSSYWLQRILYMHMPQGHSAPSQRSMGLWRSARWDRRPKRKWRQRRPTPRASVTPLRQQHSQQHPRRAARDHATAAQGRSGRQPAATAAQHGGSSGKLGQVANINTTTPNKPVPPSVINLVSPDLVPPSPPSGAQANPIDAETDQVSEGKHRRRAIFLD